MPKNQKITHIEGFTICLHDAKKVICDICAEAAPPGKEMNKGSAKGHLASKEHTRNVEVLQDRAKARREAEERRQQQLGPAAQGSQTLRLSATEIPRADVQESLPTAADDFWDALDEGSARLQMSAMDDTEEIASEKEQVRLEAVFDAFGGMNEAAVGYALGASREEELAANRELDDERQMQELLDGLSFNDSERSGDTDDEGWTPYPSKVMFLLNAADNVPRLRISESQMKLWLWILKECGVKGVPNVKSLRKFQESLRTGGSGVPTIECKSVQGKVFYMNDIRKMVANDWSNPLVRRFIHVYPEIPQNGIISELWHADKWRKDMDRSQLSPMWAAPDSQHYYVDELAQMTSGKFVIPLRWVLKGGNVFANAYAVDIADGLATVSATGAILVAAADLKHNLLVLCDLNILPTWSTDAGHAASRPNPKCAVAARRPYYVAFLIWFTDDVSGNRSKSWNKYWVAYYTHACLPRRLLQQEAHIHFVSTSQNATVTEQFSEIKKIVNETQHNPIVALDVNSMEETLLELTVIVDDSDNPMQSEVSSHMGSQGNHPCRKCEIGGPQVEKSANEMYHVFFSPGTPRSWDSVMATVSEHLEWACSGNKARIEEDQTDTGVKDPHAQFFIDQMIAEFKTRRAAARKANPHKALADIDSEVADELAASMHERYGDIINPFFMMMGHDPTQDTPVEILHTILLGIVRYIWYYSHSQWNAATKQLFAQCLQATDITGLRIPPIRAAYIMQYAGSLIGRQLKTVIQTSIFHTHDLVDPVHYTAWKAADIEVAVANVLDAFCEIDPSKMLLKSKLHLLVHLVKDIRKLGPLVGVATENFESHNAVFRAASILSNHQAPSRDIALQLADQEGARHRILGGYWKDPATQTWTRAGASVRGYIATQKDLQRLLGWTVHPDPTPAGIQATSNTLPCQSAKPGNREKDDAHKLREFCDAACLNAAVYIAIDTEWNECREVTAAHGDSCTLNSWVFYDIEGTDRSVGRIKHILAPTSSAMASVITIIECFEVTSRRHEVYDTPILIRRHGESTTHIVPAKDLQFNFNAQHDCYTGKCAATATRQIRHERQNTELTEAVIAHVGPDVFLINNTGFHNTHLLRRVLPRDLTRPIPLYLDSAERERFHHRQAATLREELGRKRKNREDAAQVKAQEAQDAADRARLLAQEAQALQDFPDSDDARPSQRVRTGDVGSDTPEVSAEHGGDDIEMELY
ncbi:hypothetical protein C8F01DRAFT_1355847 [Mycena amicta]|nr:hypothetical protein C8F01DRAFT_1355847 [Mycena amicta]